MSLFTSLGITNWTNRKLRRTKALNQAQPAHSFTCSMWDIHPHIIGLQEQNILKMQNKDVLLSLPRARSLYKSQMRLLLATKTARKWLATGGNSL